MRREEMILHIENMLKNIRKMGKKLKTIITKNINNSVVLKRSRKRTKFAPDILRVIISFVGIDRGLYSVLWSDDHTHYNNTSCLMCGRINAWRVIQPFYPLYMFNIVQNHNICSKNCIMQLIISVTRTNERIIENTPSANVVSINRELTTFWRYNMFNIDKFVISEHKKDIVLNLLKKYNVVNYNWIILDNAIIIIK
jgi:hypothetical protein